MRTVRVTDPSRVEWAVRVVWAPRHQALIRRMGAWRRDRRRDGPDTTVLDLPFYLPSESGCAGALVAVVVVIVALLVLWWLVIPLLLLLLDVLIVLVLLLIGLAARILVRRPWTVEATSAAATHQLEVAGWRRALRARDGIAGGLRSGGAAAWPSLQLRRWD